MNNGTSTNHGIHNALKMREMFESDKRYRAKFEADIQSTFPYIRVRVYSVPSSVIKKAIATYYFNNDGSYRKDVH